MLFTSSSFVYKSIDGSETSTFKPRFDSDERIFSWLIRGELLAAAVLDEAPKLSGYDLVVMTDYSAHFSMTFALKWQTSKVCRKGFIFF